MDECSYHLCNYQGEDLQKCEYCGELFCKDHILPKPPSITNFRSSLTEYPRYKGHPCIPYARYLKEQEEKARQAYRESLEYLLTGAKPYNDDYFSPPSENFWEWIKGAFRSQESSPPSSDDSSSSQDNSTSTPQDNNDSAQSQPPSTSENSSTLDTKTLERYIKYAGIGLAAILSLIIMFSFSWGPLVAVPWAALIWRRVYKPHHRNLLLLLVAFLTTLAIYPSAWPLFVFPFIYVIWRSPWDLYIKIGLIALILFLLLVFYFGLGDVDIRLVALPAILYAIARYGWEIATGIGELLWLAVQYIVFPLFVLFMIVGFLAHFFPDETRALFHPETHSYNTTLLAQEIHTLVNQKRLEHHILPLQWDNQLARIALLHSQDMALHGYFSHYNLLYESPTDRASKQGYKCRREVDGFVFKGIGENLFLIQPAFPQDEKALAQIIVEGWMDSIPHRENLLDPHYNSEGIGVAIADNGTIYVTQDLC